MIIIEKFIILVIITCDIKYSKTEKVKNRTQNVREQRLLNIIEEKNL